MYENGLLRMDELAAGQTLGYIVGGIVSDAAHDGNTAALSLIFEVVYQPVPEPNTVMLLVITATGLLGVWTIMALRRARHGR